MTGYINIKNSPFYLGHTQRFVWKMCFQGDDIVI